MHRLWVLTALLSLGLLAESMTPSSYLTTVDRERLRKVFTDSMAKDDMASLAYAVLGYKLMEYEVPQPQNVCQKLQAGIDDKEANLKTVYQATAAAQALGCKLKLSADVQKSVTAGLASDSSVTNLYYAYMAHTNLGQTADKRNVAKLLLAALKKDDSALHLGYAFKVAATLDPTDAKPFFDRIEDAVVQADEVDGKMLQLEGGLSVTYLVVTGAYQLADKMGQTPPITADQAVKFANYFLSRKSVQHPKGAMHLFAALTQLADNAHHVPVTVSLASQPTVSEMSPMVKVRITNVLGKSVGPMDVVMESATRISDAAVILSKTKMTPVADDSTAYEVNMMNAKPGRGFYNIVIQATPTKPVKSLVGHSGATLTVKALSEVALDKVELGVGDADQSVPPKMHPLTHPQKLAQPLEVDHHHKVVLKFTIKEKGSQAKISVHQAFVRMVNKKTQAEIVFVAEASNDLVYKFDLDVNAKSKEFGSVSGLYDMHLIIGDAVISNPFSWHMASLQLSFADAPSTTGQPEGKPWDRAGSFKPEILHIFREPEKRPAAVVSNAFTVMCLLPFLIMIIGWMKLGVNISGFPFTLTAIGFHLGLGGIFALYYYFWLQLDMFDTVKYLTMIGVVTFLCGNSMLSGLAEKRKQAQ